MAYLRAYRIRQNRLVLTPLGTKITWMHRALGPYVGAEAACTKCTEREEIEKRRTDELKT